jgi:hypothetical protein
MSQPIVTSEQQRAARVADPYWFDSPMAIFERILSSWLLLKGIEIALRRASSNR